MNIRILLMLISFFLSIITGFVIARSQSDQSFDQKSSKDKVLIGFSLDTLKEARWQKDRAIFVEAAEKLGAEVLVQAANSDDSRQIQDIEALISSQVDVLVIVPHNGRAMATAVEKAHQAGIPVIAYDRLIRDSEVDLYLSFDNVKVGEMQAQFLLDRLPGNRGKIIRVYGSKTDNNALLFKLGQDNILQPHIARGTIQVLHEDWAENWKPENGKKITNAAITQYGNQFEAILAANDGTAGGAIQALLEEFEEKGVKEKIIIGQDAELVACQRIVAGLQTMTIYKPLKHLATKAAELAFRMAKGKVIIAQQSVFNGKVEVPSILLEVQVVTKDNMIDTVVKDDFHKYEEIYRSIPEEQRPKRSR